MISIPVLFPCFTTLLRRRAVARLSVGVLLGVTMMLSRPAHAAEGTADDKPLAKATFAGGCFWCTEAVFAMLKGIKSVEPGYTGGKSANPTYEQVTIGDTGHVEVEEVGGLHPSTLAALADRPPRGGRTAASRLHACDCARPTRGRRR
jgi:hypothetical protein